MTEELTINEPQTELTPGLSQEIKNMIFENMSDGILVVEADGKISYINSSCEELFQLKESELTTHSFEELLMQNKQNKAFNKLFTNAIHKHIMTEKTVVKYHTSDGTLKYLSFDISLFQKEGTTLRRKEPFQGMMLLIEDVTDTYTLHQREHDCAYIFAGLIICICLYLFAWRFIRFSLHIHLQTQVYTLMIEGITFILFLEILFLTSLHMKDIGLIPRLSTWKTDLKKTVMIGGIACSSLLLVRLITFLCHAGKTYFIGGTLHGLAIYIMTAIVQEFLSRGVIQSCVKTLMQIKYQKQFSILLTSLLFSLMHMPFGFPFMMAAFLLSLALGFLYEKQGSIWGCALLHWACGYLAMALFF